MSHLHLVRCSHRVAPTPAWPGVPAIRWSVTSGLATARAHGSGDPFDGPTTPPPTRPSDERVAIGRVGGGAMYGLLVVPATDPGAGGVGGDEETRTPDPLLAKEMLFRLSYVPSRVRAGLAVWVSVRDGGRFWTRTRDLCLIRAVL